MPRPASASADRRPVNADRTEEDAVKSDDEEESSSEGTNAHRLRLRVQERFTHLWDKVFYSSPFNISITILLVYGFLMPVNGHVTCR